MISTAGVDAEAAAADAGRRAAAETDALGVYRNALAALAKKYERYPELARLRRWQGAVTVRVAVLRDGKLDNISMVRPSGHDLLDRQAVEMVNEAASALEVPYALRSRDFATELSIVFTIEEN